MARTVEAVRRVDFAFVSGMGSAPSPVPGEQRPFGLNAVRGREPNPTITQNGATPHETIKAGGRVIEVVKRVGPCPKQPRPTGTLRDVAGA